MSESFPLYGSALARHLEKHGVIATPQRLEIAEVLFRRPQHLSADQIMAAVNRGETPKVSKATVYNTLKLFSDKGLVKEVIVDPARVFNDSTTGSHHHIYNVDSGELQDIPSKEVAFSRLPELPDGMQPDGIEVIMRVRKRTE